MSQSPSSARLPSLTHLSLRSDKGVPMGAPKRDRNGRILTAEEYMPTFRQELVGWIQCGFLRFIVRENPQAPMQRVYMFKFTIWDKNVNPRATRPANWEATAGLRQVLQQPPFFCRFEKFYAGFDNVWVTTQRFDNDWAPRYIEASEHYQMNFSAEAQRAREQERRDEQLAAWQEDRRLQEARDQALRDMQRREREERERRAEEARRQAEAAEAQRVADEARGNALVLAGIDQEALEEVAEDNVNDADRDWYQRTFGVDLQTARLKALAEMTMTAYDRTLNERLSRMHAPTEARRVQLRNWQMARVANHIITTLDLLADQIVKAYENLDPPQDPVKDATHKQFVVSTDLEIVAGITVALRASTTASAAEKAIAANKTDSYSAITWTMLFGLDTPERRVVNTALVELGGYKEPTLGGQVQIRNSNTLNIALDALWEAMDITEQGEVVRHQIRAPPARDRLGAARQLPPPRQRRRAAGDGEQQAEGEFSDNDDV